MRDIATKGEFLDAGILADLQRRYAEPHRFHHTWAHIGEMLRWAEEVVNGIAERNPFILAVLFHDAVYDPRLPDRASRSAALMREALAGALPAATLARAEALILAAGRNEIPETRDPSLRGDAALFLDIDLAVLGAEEERYDAYEAAIRREHGHVPEDAYRAGRSSALQMLLWRDRLYLTDRFFLEREKRARRNIERAIARHRLA